MHLQNGRANGNRRPGASQNGNSGERLANGLGWFSIGLGVAEIMAPDRMAKLIGVKGKPKTRALLRAYGVREIAAGVGILSQTRPAGWLWSRVAGDVLDLSSLYSAGKLRGSNTTRVTAAAAAVAGITFLDVFCGQKLSRGSRSSGSTTTKDGRVQVFKNIVVNRTPEETYRFWRALENLPSFMNDLESVHVTGPKRSHWKAQGPAGKTVEWDAEIIEDQPNSLISWRSVKGSELDNSGLVRFERATGGRGTLISLEMEYAAPGGLMGANVAKLFGKEPGQQAEQSLRGFKQIMETGEVVKSDASIHTGMHAAQPSDVQLESVPA